MQCSTGKIGYATHELAKQALWHLKSMTDKDRTKPVRVFYCHECERYHLTSQVKKI